MTEKKVHDTSSPTLISHRAEKQRTGNTICVSGNNITEEFLRNQFTTFGKIVNVSMEIEKGRGFITFAKVEAAERSINDMHTKTVTGITLQVQLARRQPQIEPINDASSSAVWSTLGNFGLILPIYEFIYDSKSHFSRKSFTEGWQPER